MQNKEILKKMLANMEKKLEKAKQEIENTPQGRLVREKRGNSYMFFHVRTDSGRRIRKAITKDTETVRSLARKAYLLREIPLLEKNIKAAGGLLEEYEEISFDEILKKLPAYMAEYVLLPRENVPYEQSTYMPERKVHTTSQGIKVRSKSELLIAEKLCEYGAEFRYEQILRIGSIDFAPDFTIRTGDGRIIYWEHCGLPGNKEYMKKHKWKLEMYEQADIVPWKNLIVTYDDEDGILDLGVVESEIINKIKRRE